ncbi:MAG: hypothetical protein E2P06_01520 [Acidobacteria bacterium]|nr:MAG: hypothetical protein E2P06_01520 [Acidobacteriota bacterium]
MQIARQRCFRNGRDAAVFFVPAAVDRLCVFDADLAAAVRARDEVVPPDEVRRLALLAVRLVALAAFATDVFAARFAVLGVRLTVLAEGCAVLRGRLTVLRERRALLAFRGVDVPARCPAPRGTRFDVCLALLVARLAAAAALDAARAERCVLVNRIWSPTAL